MCLEGYTIIEETEAIQKLSHGAYRYYCYIEMIRQAENRWATLEELSVGIGRCVKTTKRYVKELEEVSLIPTGVIKRGGDNNVR
ncbi:hypothetical protein SAMN02745248_00607 [Hathewaya proteolytica DSM 3090]|uniref:HTH domain-containing protein n=1 Tax=Hathewaya proteolytica DSM 3090 TaxID=1121331 RepID=A0A1M6L3B6_9CLOT|nr:hypothetical protein [Hathewaya proteolytica]SHJ65731.1 hypothetical protein SAMN02745248_00607 [Hathewaya proteolytica DSM 3090]